MDLHQRIAPLVQAGPRFQFAVIATDAAGFPDQPPGLPLATSADTGAEQFGAFNEFGSAKILSAYRTKPARRAGAGFNAFLTVGFSMGVSAKGNADVCFVWGAFD